MRRGAAVKALLTNGVAGFIVIGAGYSATFLALSTVAAVAWLLLLTAMPETGRNLAAPDEASSSRSINSR